MQGPVAKIKEQRKNLLLILLTAILFAFGINLITSFISSLSSDHATILLYCGLSLVLMSLFLAKFAIFTNKTIIIRLNGAISFQMEGDNIKKRQIFGYDFNDDFCEYLKAFLHENKAYRKAFRNPSHYKVLSTKAFNPDDLNYHSIINSILEFMVLKELELHLNSYFVENEIEKDRITAISRKDIHPSVLRNRVIDLITKDMKEREAFLSISESQKKGVTCMAHGKNGAIYERLELELPPKSRVTRNSNGFLTIANELFEIQIMPKFEGFATNVASELMLAVEKHYAPSLAKINLSVTIKESIFLRNESLELYEWLDSFIDELNEYISVERLEKRLDPDLIRILKS